MDDLHTRGGSGEARASPTSGNSLKPLRNPPYKFEEEEKGRKRAKGGRRRGKILLYLVWIPRSGLLRVSLLLFGAAILMCGFADDDMQRTNPVHILLLYNFVVTALRMIYLLHIIHGRRVTANALLHLISKQAAAKVLKKITHLVRKGKGLVVETAQVISILTRSMMKAAILQWGILLHPLGRNLSPLRMASYETEVLDFVERETVVPSSLLGISGMRGVGKTTLLRFVRDSYAHGSFFSYVFFLGAGPGCTVKSLQHALSVNLLTTLPDVPAISTCLKGKPFLLLLDDVRERLDLAALGLPTPLGRRQKVIFTTRNHQICADMGCQSIQMECLSEDDAWNLFKDKVGQENNIDAHPHIKHLAKKMVAECCGLPSALCALGRAMSTKTDVKEWRYAYDMLKRKRSPVSEIQEIDDEGHSHLYHLEEKLQDLFF